MDWIVVDVDTNKVLPTGEVGELLMKSPLIMSHYHNKPDKTAQALVHIEGEFCLRVLHFRLVTELNAMS